MKILTALGNQHIQDNIKKNYPDIDFLLPDLAYQDGIIEAVKGNTLDALVISLDIEGDFEDKEFIELLRGINGTVKVILILKTEDKELNNWLITKGVFDVFIDGQCSFDDIYQAICREHKAIIKKEVIVQKSEPVIKEKVVTRDRIVRVGYKKLILPVVASNEFSCELAYCTARLTGQKVLLINLDDVMGYTYIYLGVKTENKDLSAQLLKEVQSGKVLNRTVFEVCSLKILDNLLLLDMAGLNASQKELQGLINVAYANFDITVIALSWDLEDLKAVATLGDAIIVCCRGFIDEWSAALKCSEKYLLDSIAPEKLLLIFHEYQRGIDLSESYLKEQLGNNFLGKTIYDVERCKARNRKCNEGFYSEMFYPFLKPQYAKILEFFDLYQRPSAINNIWYLLFKHRSKGDSKADEKPVIRQELFFSFREVSEMLRYIIYNLSKTLFRIFHWFFKKIRQLINPSNIFLLLLIYVVYRFFKAGGFDILNPFLKIFN